MLHPKPGVVAPASAEQPKGQSVQQLRSAADRTRLAEEQGRLIGRTAELGMLFDLVDRVHEADGLRALVVRGEPGIGKTSLLTAAKDHASDSGVEVLSTAGAQTEADVPFSGVHRLLMPALDGVERLPDLQRDALGSAFGLVANAAADRLLVGLAVLTLLSEKAEERPLLCTIDDAQWLDPQSTQALAFVARRVRAESMVLVFAASEPVDELQGLPELVVEGLPDAHAFELLSSVVPGRLDERVRERIVAETRGNPLALLELPKGLSPAQLAGGFELPLATSDAGSLSGRIEASFLRRLEALPADTQLLMLIAATEPVGDPALLWSAAEQLGIGYEALSPAVAAELLEVGVHVRFRHPLVRSAVYRAASPEERRKVHQALADLTDPDVEPDRRAWHRGQAATAPDEEVAAKLEQSAGRAEARGGFAAAAAFLQRAAELTAEPGRRAERTMAAAQAKHQSGAPHDALELLAIAEAGPLDEALRARGERLRAELAFALSRGDDAPPLLLSAARRLEPLDPGAARETYREALAAAITAGRRDTLLEVARAIPAVPPSQQPGPDDLLLTGWTLLTTEGPPTGTDHLKRALRALRSEDRAGEEAIRELWQFASRAAILLWDDESWHVLSARHVQLARDAGALTVLPVALAMHAESEMLAGELSSATALLEESDAVTEATGSARVVESSLLLAGWRGREAEALEVIEPALKDATEIDDDGMVTIAEYAVSILNNGLGRYDAALGAAKRSCDHHPRNGFGLVLSEMVEAAARSGETEIAAAALDHLLERTRLGDTDWALGIEARSRALLSENALAEELFREAIERLSRTRVRAELARAHLLYGEWLRRERRRRDAREQLCTAHEMFTAMGMAAFAGRTERELLAAGEKLRKRRDEALAQLTPQEDQIARLARDGLTNAEIAAQLFLSPRTVEWHLGKVFGKLGISSRMGLHDALPHTEREAALAAEQAALRRVATLVAEGAAAEDLFAAVAREVANLFGVGLVNIDRYENGESVVLASFDDPGFPVGSRWPLDGPGVRTMVYETGRPARVDDFTGVAGKAPAAARASGIKSAVAAPIVVGGNVWGVLGFGSMEEEPLPADTQERLAAFTELVSTAIANAESREELAASEARALALAEEQAALRRVATLVARELGSEEFFSTVAREVASVLNVPGVIVQRYEGDGTVVTVGETFGTELAGAQRFFAVGSRMPPDPGSLAAQVFDTHRPARIDDFSTLPGTIGDLARAAGLGSGCAGPIVVGGELWGKMCVFSRTGTVLPAGTEDRLSDFIELVATAIANYESRGRVERLAAEQSALRRVATLVAREHSPDDLFATLVEELGLLLEADAAAILRYETDATATVLAGWSDGALSLPVGEQIPVEGEKLLGEVHRTAVSARRDDYSDTTPEICGLARELGIRSAVASPIVVDGATWGVLYVLSRSQRPLPADTEARLAEFSRQAAMAVANAKSRAELAASEARARELASEQAALRRVATLVAQGASPDELFSAVAEEVAGIIDIPVVGVHRYDPDGTVTTLGISGETSLTVGTRLRATDQGIAAMILATRRPSRIEDYTNVPTDAIRDDLRLPMVGVPIVVEGGVWGFMVAATTRGGLIPAGTEERLARFTELVATAVSNATTRSELLASRARVVSAADETRRRLERDLHDGIQQWLVALALKARKAASLSPGESAGEELSHLAEDLVAVTDELRELSRGIHPAILSDAGLDDALEALARRSAIRVDLDVSFEGRYDPTLEATVYYVAAESITNAVKHAQASTVTVRGGRRNGTLELEIRDDGVGGADPSGGTGLIGLKDRVDTLRGTISLASPAGGGTTIRLKLPARSSDRDEPSPPRPDKAASLSPSG